MVAVVVAEAGTVAIKNRAGRPPGPLALLMIELFGCGRLLLAGNEIALSP